MPNIKIGKKTNIMNVVKDETQDETTVIPGKGKRKAVTVNKEVKKDYTDAEIKQLALEMVKISKDKEVLKDELKSEQDKIKSKIVLLDDRLTEILGIVGLGYQYVSAKCEMVRNFDTGNREWYFEGELIESEPLSARDHQLDIEDAEAANKEEYLRVEKEEAVKKTKELNALASTEIEELTPNQLEQFEEYVKAGDEYYKAKSYEFALEAYTLAAGVKPNNKAVINKQLKAQNWIDKQKQD